MTWMAALAWGGVVGWRSGNPNSVVGASVIGGVLLGVLYAAVSMPREEGSWGFLMALTLHVLLAVLAAMVVFYQLGQ
jgi:uncharacterized membrane protein (UPF0136 family)